MQLDTLIYLPGLISPTRKPWTGPLSDVIYDDDAQYHWDDIARRHGLDPEVEDFSLADHVDVLTIEDVRDLADDPNAVVAAEVDWEWARAVRLTRESVDRITQAERGDQALTISGELGLDPLAARLAYIEWTRSRWARADAEAAYEQALNLTPTHAERAANRAVAEAFLEAWERAREAWQTEVAEIRSGERMTGPAMRAVRTGMGLEQADLARLLRVSDRSIRAWESGETLPPTGASREVWGMWDRWIAQVRGLIPEGDEVPMFPADTPRAQLRAAALLLGGRRFTVAQED